jgi:uncharacterized SAM-binding protein YcdF (DUF218 family)
MENTQATTKHRRWNSRKILKGLLLLLVAWAILAWLGARALIVNAPLPSADAIVVFSGSSAYLERTQKAAQLYGQGRAPLVLLTNDHTRGGWSNALQRNPYFVERATEELIKGGVPANNIRIIPGLATSTHDEALLLKDYALTQSLRSVLVVTSAYHSRRALRSVRQLFNGTGVTVGLEPAGVGSATSSALWWLQFEGWRTVGAEYVKLAYYWIKYD